MTEPPSIEERSPVARDHPPFKLRERRLTLLPDLRPPSLDELRWSARERRRRREGLAPEQRSPVSHEEPEAREPADVPSPLVEQPLPQADTRDRAQNVPDEIVLPEAVFAEPELPEPEAATLEAEPDPPELDLPERDVAEPEVDPDFFDLYDPEFPDLAPWRPAVLPDPEPEPVAEAAEPTPWVEPAARVEPEPEPEPEPEVDEPSDDEADAPPLVSQVLVVREPLPTEPGRIAVLDEVEATVPTVTRLVPLPAADAAAVETPAYGDIHPADFEAYEEVEPQLEEATEADDDRPAPLYWRLLRLRYTRPNGWLRALYFEGAVALGVVLVLADVASVWTIVVLPLIVAVVVKANDVVAGSLRAVYRQPRRGR
jgi:hypothetical protein